ncbi:MAG: SAM-dependent methyltransferase [Bacteroidetes bacterium]|nr:MAG: SAM-dependent methyltransferase [Bacteroidota bacterium]
MFTHKDLFVKIFETQDGSHSILSEKFGVSYHSKYGAIQETLHVFIGEALRLKALETKKIAILETGFGTGLNALMTWLDAEQFDLQIDYVTLETFPLPAREARLLNYPEQLKRPDIAPVLWQMHESEWEKPVWLSPFFRFEKKKTDFREIDFSDRFDIVYFDAFAPSAQPELWTPEVLGKMYKSLKINGVFVTYCAKGVVKRTLRDLGFKVESPKGPPGKREMTRAIKVPLPS